MAKKLISECDGTFCGANIKRGSIDINRIKIGQFEQAIQKFFEDKDNQEWVQELFLNNLKILMPTLLKQDWFTTAICSMNCGDINLFDVIPETMDFGALGGTKELQIIVGAEDEWTLK